MGQAAELPISPEEMTRGAMDREDDISIAYEAGFCFPHIRRPFLKDLHIGIGILPQPVKIKDNDKDPARVIIFSLISPETSDAYLMTLAAFTRYLAKAENLAKFADSGNPAALLELLHREDVRVKDILTAEDIMARDFRTLKMDDPIGKALDIFSSSHRTRLPVLDAENRLVGVIDAGNIITRSIPEYLMMMDNLNFLTSFEPFSKLLEEETRISVSELMEKPKAVIRPDTPLIQLTVNLVKNSFPVLFVTDEEQHLLGDIYFQQWFYGISNSCNICSESLPFTNLSKTCCEGKLPWKIFSSGLPPQYLLLPTWQLPPKLFPKRRRR